MNSQAPTTSSTSPADMFNVFCSFSSSTDVNDTSSSKHQTQATSSQRCQVITQATVRLYWFICCIVIYISKQYWARRDPSQPELQFVVLNYPIASHLWNSLPGPLHQSETLTALQKTIEDIFVFRLRCGT